MLDKTRGPEHPAPYSLCEPLPSNVVLRPGRGSDYRSYPVFSGPWLRGRSLIFAPAVAGIGVLQGFLIGVGLNDWHLALMWCPLGAVVWVIMATQGPALATLVRHQRWPLRRERPAVVAAVALGVALGLMEQHATNVLADATLMPAYHRLLGDAAPRLLHNPTPLVTGVLTLWQIVLFTCLGGGAALRTYFSEQKRWREAQREEELEELRQQKGEADLKVAVLQAQVEPHFLFNTLACLHSLIRQDPARAEATVEALVDHLRATMPKLRAGIGQSYSTLAEQLDVCESYLRVMQVRMGERLGYVRDVPEGLLRHPFPPLLLISLVENAIKHGIEPQPAGGSISLCAGIEDRGTRQLAVSVIDDGAGLAPGLGGGVGLANIRAQLAARFGDYGELSIRARPAGGVVATIRVPCAQGAP